MKTTIVDLPRDVLVYLLEGFCNEMTRYMCLFVSRQMSSTLQGSWGFGDRALIESAAIDCSEGSLRQMSWLRSRFRLRMALPNLQPSHSPQDKLRLLVALGPRETLRRELHGSRKIRRSLESSAFCIAAILRNGDVMSLLRSFQCPVGIATRCAESARRPGNVRWLRARMIE